MRWALLGLFAVLSLQWVVVPLPIVGPRPFFLLGLVAFAGIVFARYRAAAFRPVLSTTAPFLVACAVLVAVWLATALYHGQGIRDTLEQAILLCVFLAVAVVIHRGARYPESRVLHWARWAALACGGAFLIGLTVSTAAVGVDGAAVVAETVSEADPEILQQRLFQPAFTAFGMDPADARSSQRHEIFSAMLTAIFLSIAATRLCPFRSRGATALYRASIVVAALLVVFSMSRSVIIAAAAWPILSVWRSARAGRLSRRQLVAGFFSLAVAALLAVTGVLSVLWLRFTADTTSYEKRDLLLEQALRNIGDHVLLGGVDTVGASSHNLVLDSWLRAGVLGAAAALVVVAMLVGSLLMLAARLHLEPDWMLPITCALALPVVRVFTVGGGQIPPVQWVCLGVVAGMLAHRARLNAEPVESNPTSDSRAASAQQRGRGGFL